MTLTGIHLDKSMMEGNDRHLPLARRPVNPNKSVHPNRDDVTSLACLINRRPASGERLSSWELFPCHAKDSCRAGT